jgi:hypothetical protein
MQAKIILIIKSIVFVFLFLLIFTSLPAKDNKNKIKYPNYYTLRILLPTSLLERESIYSMGIQFKYHRIGIELEFGRILGLNSYSQNGPLYEAKTKGNRARINLKYYIHSFKFNDKSEFHIYSSFMPSLKKVKYKMNRWVYDSLTTNNTYQYAESHIPVEYSSKSLCLNALIGNEIFISHFNVDFYVGAGTKMYDINIPNSAPAYFEPYSRPKKRWNLL